MNSLFKLLLFSVLIVSCSKKPSVINESSLIGSWECLSGCDAEIYKFSKSESGFIYQSFKNQAILKTGTFYMKDSLLTLKSDDGVTDTFIAELRNDSLILDDGKLVLTFYIEKTDLSNHTDELFVGMEDLLKVFPDFDFSNQEPVDFTYKLKIFDNEYETITIAGIGVKTKIILGTDFITVDDVINRITNVFLEQGFKPDKLNDSENCNTYISENMVFMICVTETQPNEFGGEMNMEINFGFIK